MEISPVIVHKPWGLQTMPGMPGMLYLGYGATMILLVYAIEMVIIGDLNLQAGELSKLNKLDT